MKHIITTIAFVFISITISAKTVVKNPATGKVLDNTMGVYSIKGNSGVIILGAEDQARHFMISAADCFAPAWLDTMPISMAKNTRLPKMRQDSISSGRIWR